MVSKGLLEIHNILLCWTEIASNNPHSFVHYFQIEAAKNRFVRE